MKMKKTFQTEGTAGANTQRLKKYRVKQLGGAGVQPQGYGREAVGAGQMLNSLVHHVTASELHLANNRGPLRYFRQGCATG